MGGALLIVFLAGVLLVALRGFHVAVKKQRDARNVGGENLVASAGPLGEALAWLLSGVFKEAPPGYYRRYRAVTVVLLIVVLVLFVLAVGCSAGAWC